MTFLSLAENNMTLPSRSNSKPENHPDTKPKTKYAHRERLERLIKPYNPITSINPTFTVRQWLTVRHQLLRYTHLGTRCLLHKKLVKSAALTESSHNDRECQLCQVMRFGLTLGLL